MSARSRHAKLCEDNPDYQRELERVQSGLLEVNPEESDGNLVQEQQGETLYVRVQGSQRPGKLWKMKNAFSRPGKIMEFQNTSMEKGWKKVSMLQAFCAKQSLCVRYIITVKTFINCPFMLL